MKVEYGVEVLTNGLNFWQSPIPVINQIRVIERHRNHSLIPIKLDKGEKKWLMNRFVSAWGNEHGHLSGKRTSWKRFSRKGWLLVGLNRGLSIRSWTRFRTDYRQGLEETWSRSRSWNKADRRHGVGSSESWSLRSLIQKLSLKDEGIEMIAEMTNLSANPSKCWLIRLTRSISASKFGTKLPCL